LVKEIESRENCLCILINNAGIAGNTQQTEAKTAEEMKKNLFDDESSTFDGMYYPSRSKDLDDYCLRKNCC
jgi:hypothetical protein